MCWWRWGEEGVGTVVEAMEGEEVGAAMSHLLL